MAPQTFAHILVLSIVTTSAMATSMSIVPKNKPSLCLDLLGERTQSGTPIDIWNCTAGLLGQQWFFDAGTYKIRSAVNPKKCIDGGVAKANLTLSDCDDASTTQLFGWDVTTNAIYASPDKGALKPTGSVCLQITPRSKEGDTIVLAACSRDSKYQQWAAVVGPPPAPKANETFTFSPDGDIASKRCLTLEDGVDNGSPVHLKPCTGNKSQEWIFSQGTYRIASTLNPKKCIDATNMKKGTPLVVWDCNGFPQQQWGYKQTPRKSTGTVYLTQASDSGECLSVDLADHTKINCFVGECVEWTLQLVKPHLIIV